MCFDITDGVAVMYRYGRRIIFCVIYAFFVAFGFGFGTALRFFGVMVIITSLSFLFGKKPNY